MVTGNMIETKLDKRSFDIQPRPRLSIHKQTVILQDAISDLYNVRACRPINFPRVVALQPSNPVCQS